MEPKHPSAERKLVAPSAKGAAALLMRVIAGCDRQPKA